MVETLAMAESKSSQPSPPRCPLVRSHSLRSVPFISLGFTTGLPRWPFPKVEGAVLYPYSCCTPPICDA